MKRMNANQLINLVSKMIAVHYAAIEVSINLGDADGAGNYAAKLAHFVRKSIPGVA